MRGREKEGWGVEGMRKRERERGEERREREREREREMVVELEGGGKVLRHFFAILLLHSC